MSGASRRPALLALAAALVAAMAAPARAFVRSTTEAGTPVYWGTSSPTIVPDTDPPASLTLDAAVATLDRSIADWQTPTLDAGCSWLRLVRAAPAPGEAKLDRRNVVKFRKDKWCRPADSAESEMCYSPDAAAITTVFYNDEPGKSGDGAIVDADIELNAVNWNFVNEPSSPMKGNDADLENTLTHELGHFQGLDHTCWDHSTPTQPKDDMGNLVPDCNLVMAHMVPQAEYDQITQSTMYNFARPGETSKRSPEADDIRAICDIYHVNPDPGGCSVGPATRPAGARRRGGALALVVPLLVGGAAAFAARRRRRARNDG